MGDPQTPDPKAPKPNAPGKKPPGGKQQLSKEELLRRKKILLARKKKALAEKKAAEARNASAESNKLQTSFSALVNKDDRPRRKPAFANVEPAPDSPPPSGEPAPPRPQPRVKAPARPRKPPTKTRSRSSYEQVQKSQARLGIRQTLVFLAMGLVLAGGLYWYMQANAEIGRIIQAHDDGYTALATLEYDAAREHFMQAYRLYREGYDPQSELLWSTQSRLMPIMTKVAIGFATLEDFQMSIETFREISIRINEPESSWTWLTLREDFERLAATDYWSQANLTRLYLALASEDPEDWKLGATELVRVTELTGMVMLPISVRYQDADIVLYGTITGEAEGMLNQFTLAAETIYKSDMDYPADVTVALASRLRTVERNRIRWYVDRNASVIIFARMGERLPVIESLEGIVLSSEHTVGDFNQAYEMAESDGTSSLMGSTP